MVTNTEFTGKFLLHLDRVGSTNDYAKEYLSKTTPNNGAVILADEQFAGRGQAGSTWTAEPAKNLTFSIIYRSDFLPAAAQFGLSMAVALGLREAVADLLGEALPIRIKWPNDIYAGDSKLAGILIENIIQGANLSKSVIGIGLNVNSADFPEAFRAASLLTVSGRTFDRMSVLDRVLQKIESRFLRLRSGDVANLRADYLEKLYRFGEWHQFSDSQGSFCGRIHGVNDYGYLQVDTENGIREYAIKEVRFEDK